MFDGHYLCGYDWAMRPELIDARRAVGLTQSQLATLVGKDQGAISRYEHGLQGVPVDIAPRLAKALGISILVVLYGTDKP